MSVANPGLELKGGGGGEGGDGVQGGCFAFPASISSFCDFFFILIQSKGGSPWALSLDPSLSAHL